MDSLSLATAEQSALDFAPVPGSASQAFTSHASTMGWVPSAAQENFEGFEPDNFADVQFDGTIVNDDDAEEGYEEYEYVEDAEDAEEYEDQAEEYEHTEMYEDEAEEYEDEAEEYEDEAEEYEPVEYEPMMEDEATEEYLDMDSEFASAGSWNATPAAVARKTKKHSKKHSVKYVRPGTLRPGARSYGGKHGCGMAGKLVRAGLIALVVLALLGLLGSQMHRSRPTWFTSMSSM